MVSSNSCIECVLQHKNGMVKKQVNLVMNVDQSFKTVTSV